MSAMQRTKGASFERYVARVLRAKWPSVEVHRGQQGNGAWHSDVYIAGEKAPPLLTRVWWELQDSAHPTPRLKLMQAENDCRPESFPVVVWHKLRERAIYVTLRLETLLAISGIEPGPLYGQELVWLELSEFLDLVDVGVVRRIARGA